MSVSCSKVRLFQVNKYDFVGSYTMSSGTTDEVYKASRVNVLLAADILSVLKDRLERTGSK